VNVGDRSGDELVVFEGSQTLPLFLVYTTEFDGAIERMTSTGEATGRRQLPKAGVFLNQASGAEGEDGSVLMLVLLKVRCDHLRWE